MKNKNIATISLIVFILAAVSAMADKYTGWQSYTSTGNVRFLTFFDDSVQVLSSGGWLKVDPNTHGYRKIVNTDGLGTNNLNHIIKDGEGVVWVAGHGRLNKVVQDEITPFLFYDREENLINLMRIFEDGDNLWIGTSAGLALFSKSANGGQIEDIYNRFGDFNAEIVVNDILIRGDTIWIATGNGLAWADKSDPKLLKSFANWRTLRPTDYVSTTLDSIQGLVYFKDNLYIGTSRDVFRLNMSENDTSLTDIPTRANIKVRNMAVEGDSLMIYSSGGIFTWSGTAIDYGYVPSDPNYSLSSGLIINGVHWVGNFLGKGVYYGYGTEYDHLDDGGIPGNSITGLHIDSSGIVLGAFSNNGMASFDGEKWEAINYGKQLVYTTSVLVDDDNNQWIGSWGSGLYYSSPDTFITYNKTNSPLIGVNESADSSYVVITDLAEFSDYIFMTSYIPWDWNTVHWVNKNNHSNWGTIGIDDDLVTNLVNSIAVKDSLMVLGTPDKGVWYYYFGPSLTYKADDSVVLLSDQNSWLGSDEVRTVEFDSKGNLWVGTKFGIARFDVGIDHFVEINLPVEFGPDVSHIKFDRRGNIWIGSSNGLCFFDSLSSEISIYNTTNSGLLNNNITAMAIDPVSNDLWIGTVEGISRFSSKTANPTNDVNQVLAYPNPFVIHSDGDRLSFNYNGNAIVRIYTVSGELLWENDINIAWTGRNQSGQKVASGVYLFLITDENGSTGQGKIFLVRE
ncbi:MAG: two-component regulator propeller domain-containing protein [Candidatus Zixiibacteriota bacterium]